MNQWRWFITWPFTLGLLVFAVNASAQSQCYLSAECDEDKICNNRECVVPEDALQPCSVDKSCSSSYESCDDGYCKPIGALCENDAGHCESRATSGGCGCATGEGVDWDSEFDEDDPVPSGEELYASCVEALVTFCGDEAPNISDYCDANQLDRCTALIEKMHHFDEICWEDDDNETDEKSSTILKQDGPSFWELRACCEDLEDPEMLTYIECIEALAEDDCNGAEECFGNIEPTDDDFNGDDNDKTEDGDTDKSDDETAEGVGCAFTRPRQTTNSPVTILIAGLFY